MGISKGRTSGFRGAWYRASYGDSDEDVNRTSTEVSAVRGENLKNIILLFLEHCCMSVMTSSTNWASVCRPFPELLGNGTCNSCEYMAWSIGQDRNWYHAVVLDRWLYFWRRTQPYEVDLEPVASILGRPPEFSIIYITEILCNEAQNRERRNWLHEECQTRIFHEYIVSPDYAPNYEHQTIRHGFKREVRESSQSNLNILKDSVRTHQKLPCSITLEVTSHHPQHASVMRPQRPGEPHQSVNDFMQVVSVVCSTRGREKRRAILEFVFARSGGRRGTVEESHFDVRCCSVNVINCFRL